MFDTIKQAALLRRIAKASERQATALETIARTMSDWWAAQHPIRSTKHTAKIEFGVALPSEIEQAFLERLEREALGNFGDGDDEETPDHQAHAADPHRD
jgi:hypothetical protein